MKIPSIGIDQNGEGDFVDKYYGRVPMYLHRIPETIGKPHEEIVVCNPEYVKIVRDFIDGTLNEKNLGRELYLDVLKTVNLIPGYGKIPMPKYDEFFKYAGFDPGVPLTDFFQVIDAQFNGAFLWTADGEIFGVQPE